MIKRKDRTKDFNDSTTDNRGLGYINTVYFEVKEPSFVRLPVSFTGKMY